METYGRTYGRTKSGKPHVGRPLWGPAKNCSFRKLYFFPVKIRGVTLLFRFCQWEFALTSGLDWVCSGVELGLEWSWSCHSAVDPGRTGAVCSIFHQDIEIFVWFWRFSRLYLDKRQINPVLNEYYLKQEVFGDWENSMLEISFRFTSLGVPRGRAVGIQIGFRSASERQFWLSLKAGRK